MANLFPL